jgi:fructan beta-fructosidase
MSLPRVAYGDRNLLSLRWLWLVCSLLGWLPERIFAAERYHEPLRPRYHFTAASDAINDPNGLFSWNGEYHLFFQAGPISAKKWGHAVSPDLLHWRQLSEALLPERGHPAFSGCAVIDHQNTAGFQQGSHPAVVAIFSSWGEGQALAYSADSGSTWQRYPGNPVLTLPHDAARSFPLSARDPLVIWDQLRKRWVMVLYHNPHEQFREGVPRDRQGGISFFTAPNLKDWTWRSHLPGFYVCPDLCSLPIEQEGGSAWVLMDWSQYVTGTFDGERFVPDGPPRPLDYGANLSANQTWKDLPDGRVIQTCWIRGGKYPGMPFDQQHSVPTELSLRRMAGQLHLCKAPVRELDQVADPATRRALAPADVGNTPIELPVSSNSFELQLDIACDQGSALVVDVLGQPVVIRHDRVQVRDREALLPEPLRELRILADVTSIELFANRGLVTMTWVTSPPAEPQPVRLSRFAGQPRITRGRYQEFRNTWDQ